MDGARSSAERRPKRKNPRFRRESRPASARSQVPRHDPTYSNRKTVYPRGAEEWEEHEYFVKEKYDLLLDLDELRKECRALKRELARTKEQNYEAEQESLLGECDADADRTVLLSTQLEDLRVELKGLDDQLRLYEEMFTPENEKELEMVILQQRSEMMALNGEYNWVSRKYTEAQRGSRDPTLSKAKRVYEQQISVMDMLTRKLRKHQARGEELAREKTILEAPVPLHGDKQAELEKLKKKHKNLMHVKSTRKADCKALETTQNMELEMLRDLKRQEDRHRNETRERSSFQKKAAQRRNTYRSRAPGNIAADKIDYAKPHPRPSAAPSTKGAPSEVHSAKSGDSGTEVHSAKSTSSAIEVQSAESGIEVNVAESGTEVHSAKSNDSAIEVQSAESGIEVHSDESGDSGIEVIDVQDSDDSVVEVAQSGSASTANKLEPLDIASPLELVIS